MNRILTFLLAVISVMSSFGKTDDSGVIKAKYDERVELMSIICRLAGFREYNMDMTGKYIADIDSCFAEFKSHPAVIMMDNLRRSNGISYDAPMSFAINLTKAGNDFVLVNDTVAPETRWEGLDLKKVASTISDFYTKSNFSDFFKSHIPFYEAACADFDSSVISKFNQDWYSQFYGMPPTENYEVVIGFTNGGQNYGPSCQFPGQPRNVFAIMGYALNENGVPYYTSNPEFNLNTLVHEFNHSFVNPLAENPEFAPGIEAAGSALMPYCRTVMRRIAYSTWASVVDESIVRAAVILYLLDNGASEEFVRNSVLDEMSTGFVWTPELVSCLQDYSKNRKKYPSFDLYYPKIIEFFKNYTDGCSKKVDAIFKNR